MGLAKGAGKAFRPLRDNDEMDMIVHETGGKDMQAETVALLPHEPEIRKPVVIGKKNVQRANTALGAMVGGFRDHHPCHSYHIDFFSTNAAEQQELYIVPPE